MIKEQERIVRARFARVYVKKALEAFYTDEQESFRKVQVNKAKEVNPEEEEALALVHGKNGHHVAKGGKGLVCKNCLRIGKSMAVFKDLCDGVPVLVKKIIDDIGGTHRRNEFRPQALGGPCA